MDLLQIALIFLIILLSILLSVLSIQVFFILKDLKKSLDKIDIILGDAEKPVKAVADMVSAVETGVKTVQKISGKQTIGRRLFKKKIGFKIK